MKKKILLVANTSWYIYNFRLGLAQYLIKSGFMVKAVTPYDRFTKKLRGEGIEVVTLNNLERKGKNLLKDLSLIGELYKIYKNEKPSLIIHFTIKPNIYGLLAGRLSKTKCTSVVTGLGHVFIKKSFLQYLVKLLYKISFSSAASVVFQTSADMDFFVAEHIIPQKKALLIRGSGVDTEFFSPVELSPKKGDNRIIFLMVSRLLKDKGIEEFVGSAEILRHLHDNTEFWLLGPFDEGNPAAIPDYKIKQWVRQGHIHYFAPVDDVREYLMKCDVFVMPSYREGVSRSILEAMAMEKPVVTTDTPGCNDTVVDEITGFLVPPKNTEVLAEALEKIILIGKDKREAMGKSGRDRVLRNFTEKKVIAEYVNRVINENL